MAVHRRRPHWKNEALSVTVAGIDDKEADKQDKHERNVLRKQRRKDHREVKRS